MLQFIRSVQQFIWRVALVLCVLVPLSGLQAALPDPVFQVTQNPPSYPLVFVASRNYCIPVNGVYVCKNNNLGDHPHTGTDAMHADKPQNPGVLYVLLPDRQVKKIFPLPNHLAVLGFTNVNQFDQLAVVEPNVSVNGRSVIITVFPNFETSFIKSPKSDLFRVDLGPLIDNPNVDPATLTVTRLTTQPANAFADALNPTLAQNSSHFWAGVANMHGIEVPWDKALYEDPVFGPIKVVFVSNQKKARSSNGDSAKKNLNLYVADIGPTGALVNINQFQYYTTTSALSPQNMRDGIAFSYLGNDKSVRHWEIQSLTTAGVWKPLHGFGKHASNATHLGTLCATQNNDDNGVHDFQVTASYYDGNNNGFGAILSLPMSGQGANDTLSQGGGVSQVGEQLLTLGASDIQDEPARFNPTTNTFAGKFSTPACGAPNQLFLSQANSYAHSGGGGGICRSAIGSGSVPCPANKGAYDARIIFRDNLNPFNPITDGVNVVIDDVSDQGGGFSNYALVWPRPVINLQTRFGGSMPKRSIRSASKLGLPVAQVGTSALWNTDVKPPECYSLTNPFLPSRIPGSTNENNFVYENIALLGIVRDNNNISLTDPNSSCVKPVLPAMVGGVSVVMTDSKVDPENIDYIWERKEGKKILGVYGTGFVNQSFNGQEDHSFQAVIPSNVPFSLQLLSKKYGLRIADVDSWHSLKPFEKRNDCGGCHGHEMTMSPVDISTTLAGQQNYVPADFVTQTPYVTYDSLCNPVMRVDPAPTREIPLWGNSTPLFQGIVAQCGSCHASGSATGNATFAIIPNNAEATFHEMSRYLSSTNVDSTNAATRPLDANLGAVGSSAWWAMRGERADGRANCPSSVGTDGQFWCFHPEHHRNLAGGPMFCDGSNPQAATLVYDFGLWLDNNMPRERQFPGQLGYGDRFHPSVNGALIDKEGCTISQGLTVGYWDDTGSIASLKLEVQGQAPIVVTQAPGGGPLTNGVYAFTAAQIAGLTDVGRGLKVTAVDATGNQQSYSLTRKELEYECQVGSESIGEVTPPLDQPTPGPNGNSPSPTPGPSSGVPPSGYQCVLKGSRGGKLMTKITSQASEAGVANVVVFFEQVSGKKIVRLAKKRTNARGIARLEVASQLASATKAGKRLKVRARHQKLCSTSTIRVR